VSRLADLTLDERGGISGNITINMTGQEALSWRQKSLKVDESELKKQFKNSIEPTLPDGVEVTFDHFQALEDPDANLVVVLKVKGSLASVTPKRMMLPAAFFETRNRQPFVDSERRLEPVDMHYGEQVNDKVVYHVPVGLSVEGTPQDAKLSWAGHAALVAKVVVAPTQILSSRSLARGFIFVPADGYKDLRDFYQKVAANDQQQIVLARTPAGSGTPAVPAPAALNAPAAPKGN
jgi:hypothetical protein